MNERAGERIEAATADTTEYHEADHHAQACAALLSLGAGAGVEPSPPPPQPARPATRRPRRRDRKVDFIIDCFGLNPARGRDGRRNDEAVGRPDLHRRVQLLR